MKILIAKNPNTKSTKNSNSQKSIKNFKQLQLSVKESKMVKGGDGIGVVDVDIT